MHISALEISARSYLAAGVSLTAATAIALTPLAIPDNRPVVTIPNVTASNVSTSDVELTVSPADIEALILEIQSVLDDSTAAAAGVAGIPGQGLIGVATTIETLFDVVFSGLVDVSGDPTLDASLTILKTLSVDAYAKLAENLGRINAVIVPTVAQVGDFLTDALTGSLRNVLVALVNVVNDPLSPASYTGLLTAGIASAQLVIGNGLEAIQSVGDAAFDIVGIAVDEVTFQFNNAVSGLSALATQLAEATDSALVEGVVGAVLSGAVAPAVGVVNLGSGLATTVLTTANAGFDAVLDGATDVVEPAEADVTVETTPVETASFRSSPDPVVSSSDSEEADPEVAAETDDAGVEEDAVVDEDAVMDEDAAVDDDEAPTADDSSATEQDGDAADDTESAAEKDDDNESTADKPSDTSDSTSGNDSGSDTDSGSSSGADD